MILTLYYMAATCLQWYRLERIKNRFVQYLSVCNVPLQEIVIDESQPSSSREIVSTAPPVSKGIILYRGTYDITLAENQKLGDLLCYEGDCRCCTVIPEKRVDLSVWIGFSKGYSTIPFEIIEDDIPTDTIKNINLLLHASLEPADNIDEIHLIRIEHIGIPIAWKIDSMMCLIVRTDVQLFTSLSAAFMSKNVAINNHLKLLRIETVSLSGKVYECRPKDMILGVEWFKKFIPKQWNAHIMQLKNLCSHIKHRHRDDLLKHHRKMLPGSKRTTDDSKYEMKKSRSSSKREMIKTSITHLATRDIDLCTTQIANAIVQNGTTDLIVDNKSTKDDSGGTVREQSDRRKHHDRASKTHKLKKQKSVDMIEDKKIMNKSTDAAFVHHNRKYSEKDLTEMNVEKSKKRASKDEKTDEPLKQEIMNIIENPINNIVNADFVIEKPVNKNQLMNGSVVHLEQPSIITPAPASSPSQQPQQPQPQSQSQEPQQPPQPPQQPQQTPPPPPPPPQSQSEIKKSDSILSNIKLNTPLDENTVKPPNVLIYADSAVERDNVSNLLKSLLHKDKYTVYSLSTNSVWWGSKAILLVVCGAVADHLGAKILDYLLSGGRIFCLCSDFLNTVLPTFTTAEVREKELVRFTYDRWHRVRMIHHIFCYQPSPGRKQFSKDSSDEVSPNSNRCPTSSIIEVRDSSNVTHKLEVKILGAEDTWHTPSLILATDKISGGVAIFSQVHLEVEPSQFESNDNIYSALAESNTARLDIIRHILENHLGLECADVNVSNENKYTTACFLGNHELKLALLEKLASGMANNTYNTAKLKLQFCGKGVEPNPASATYLPILVHACPENFSTVVYFENLETKCFGRLVIYSDIIDSTMNVFSGVQFEHGMAVVAKKQLAGVGRGGNHWLSPEGCAMFSLQLHIPVNSILGQRCSLVQILTSVVIVHAIRSIPGYENLDIGLKWPNDIYANKRIKLGGLIVNSTINTTTVICNIGVGINLSNTYPTTCINSLIKEYNESNNKNLSSLSLERFLAHIFNEYERIYDKIMSTDSVNYLYDLYYRYWLHDNTNVTILSESGTSMQAKIIGIDDYGFLKVSANSEIFTVHPDGNSFDMLVGLIAPKLK